MSTTIDSKVVEMRFDNKHFESNVRTTMSTLDKLKQKLNLSGAAKGLENINGAAKKVDMAGLGSAVESVRTKFSALEVMGVTALANITNAAVNAGKRIVSSLTIEPISDGFKEYEMTLNAVQTTMAGTGKTAEEVEAELKKLDEYADKTVYSTADMLNNLPKFTNAGVELEKSTTAMIGIANATALAGGDAQKASIAFYNLGQAIGTGYLTRMDYNSINNATIATMEWKNQMVDAAIAAGTLTKAGDDLYTAGGKTFTLQQLFIDGLQEQWATTDVMLKVFGDYGDETTEIGKKAYSAAQDIKTFSQMMESLKATAGTGWKDTWQIIFGDLGEAKQLWTGLTNFISGIITKMADFRNTLLESALGRGFKTLSENIKTILKPVEAVKTAVDAIKDYDKVVDEIINGKWGNGQSRWDKLAKEGYDWAHAQNLVNEKLGVSLRRETDYKEAQKETAKTQTELNEIEAKRIAQLASMSDAQLRSLGYSDKQIKAFRDLKEAADKLGMPLEEFIEKMDEIDGRWLIIESFKNAGKALGKVFTALKDAWVEIFPPKSMEERSEQIFNIISALHKFSRSLIMNDDTADKLKRTFKGLFAIIDIITTLTAGPFKIAFKLISSILGYFNLNILDVTAVVGDAVVKFSDWIDKVVNFDGVVAKVIPYLQSAATATKEWFNKLKESERIQQLIAYIRDGIDTIKTWITAWRNGEEIPNDVINGLVNGLKSGVKKVWDAAVALAKGIWDGFCEFMGIHSPSKKMEEAGGFTIDGLINGIQNGLSELWEIFKNIGAGIVDFIKDIDFGQISAALLGAGMLMIVKKMLDVMTMIADPLENIGGALGNALNAKASEFKASAMEKRAKAMLNIAKAIGILAISLAILTLVDHTKLFGAVLALAALAGVLGGLAFAASKMGSVVKFGGYAIAILSLSAALVIMAVAMQKISSIEKGDRLSVLATLGGMILGLVAIMGTLGVVARFGGDYIDQAGKTIAKMSIAILLMVFVMKLAAKLDNSELEKGIAFVVTMEVLFGAIIAISRLAGANAAKAGTMLLLMSGAFLTMVTVVKQAAKMDNREVERGLGVVAMVGTLFAAMIVVSRIAGENGSKAGGMLLLMSGAFLIMTNVIENISKMDASAIDKGLAVVGSISVLFAALIAVSRVAGDNAMKAGMMLLAMSGALLILTGVIFIIGELDPSSLNKGLAVVTFLEIVFGGLIAVTHLAKDCKDELTAITIAIGILAGAIIALSFIDPRKLATATTGLTMVISAFALLVAATHYSKNTKTMRKSLLLMVGVIAALAGIVALLSLLNPDTALRNASALSILLVSFSTSIAILGKAGKMSTTISKQIGPMLGVTVALAAVVALLSFIDTSSALGSTMALSILLTAFSTSLVIMSKAGKMSTTISKQIGPMLGVTAALAAVVALLSLIDASSAISSATALSILLTAFSASLVIMSKAGRILPTVSAQIYPMLGIVAGLAAILGIMSALDVTASIGSAIALSILLNAMATAMVILGTVAKTSTTAIGAMALLGLVVAELAVVLGLMDKFDVKPSIETATALSILLVSMSGALILLGAVGAMGPAAFIGIGALATLITSLGAVIVAIGALATEFPSLQTFLDTGVPILEQIGSALGSFFGNIMGGFMEGMLDGLVGVGEDLTDFWASIQPFVDGVKTVDKSTFDGVKNMAKTIMLLTAADLLDSIVGWITGKSSLAEFGKELVPFGESMAAFSAVISGNFDSDTVDAAANCGKTLSELANNIPKSGGLVQFFTGVPDWAAFNAGIVGYAKAVVAFSNTIGTTTISENAVTTAANCGKVLAGLANEIPKTGGLLQLFTGVTDWAAFNAGIVGYANAMVAFSNTIGTTTINDSAVTTAANCGKVLAGLANEIPKDGGFIQLITGVTDWEAFNAGIAGYAKAVVSFSETVKGLTITEDDITTASMIGDLMVTLQSSVEKTGGLFNIIEDIFTGKKDMDDVEDAMDDIGSAMDTFYGWVKDIDMSKMKTAIDQAGLLIDMMSGISGMNTLSAGAFSKSLKEFAETGIRSFCNAFKSDKKDDVETAIDAFVDTAIKRVNKNISTFTEAFDSLVQKTVKFLKTRDIQFAYVGKCLVEGFASGITTNTYKAEAASAAMAEAALEAAREELDVNSPSKVFRKLGTSVPEGFAQGVSKLSSVVVGSARNMADSAINSTRNALNRVADIVNSDIDSQPTIRPVVDLSDLRAGVGLINGMFNMSPSVGLMGDLGYINVMMNRRHQNGANDDVVSAIGKLEKTVGSVKGNTYNTFGDVTYGDDSAISEAVESLIRAIMLERRT